ncbi:MAG: hypothetical protein WC731_02125 [Candidatus Omnitrophota bacterium]|jgi:hypothetical protein
MKPNCITPAPECVPKLTPFSAQAGDYVASHISPALNYDLIIDCVQAYPAYQSYFSEKLEKVARLEDRISDPKLRAEGETKTFLKQWRERFLQQINFMITHLKKDKQNG